MPHRRDLSALTCDERRRLADLIMKFLTDSMVAEHIAVAAGSDVLHPSHEQFFSNHRAYISKLEGFLINNGAREFVPLPAWNDQNSIPAEFWGVKPKDDGTPRAFLNRLYNSLPPPLHPLPDKVKLPQLCSFSDAEQVTHELVPWHGEVHMRLGGVMFKATPQGPDPTTEAAAALIFWPWHAFNDEIYHNWERCKLLGCKSLTVGRNADGRLEVFATGPEGELWHCWQESIYGGWSLWWSLGGISKQIVVSSNADGRLELFAIGSDDALYHIWQHGWDPNKWAGLGGWHRQIAVGKNKDGRLEVFAIGSDNALYHIWQRDWQGWHRLGGWHKQIAVGRNLDGRLEVFAIGSDDAVYHIWQQSPGGAWSSWSGFGRPNGQPVRKIAVGTNQDGRLEVFAAGPNAQIWHIRQTAPNNGWSGWSSVGRAPAFDPPIAQLAVEIDSTGRLNLFALNEGGLLLYALQNHPDTGENWADWVELDSTKRFDSISIGKHSNGRLEVFGVVKGDVIWHMWQWSAVAWERWQLL